MMQLLIPAITGFISGAIGSVVAPWVLWKIEKHRNLLAARQALLSEIRALLSDPPHVNIFREMPIYFRIEPFLAHSTVEMIQSFGDNNVGIVVVNGRVFNGNQSYARHVLTDVAKAALDWGCI